MSRTSSLKACATIAAFRVSGDDAIALVREFAASGEGPRTAEQTNDTIIPASELQNLPDYTLYVRTLVRGRPQDPYLVHSYPSLEGKSKETDAAAPRSSSRRYGRNRPMVERRIEALLQVSK